MEGAAKVRFKKSNQVINSKKVPKPRSIGWYLLHIRVYIISKDI